MFKKLITFISLSLLLSACQLKLPFINQKQAGLQVTSTPQSSVMLDGESLGSTPLVKEDLSPGEYTLKLTPQDPNLSSWQTTVTLSPGILTVIDRKLSSDPNQNHGYVLTFEKLASQKNTELAVSTLPDSVNVTVDGSPKGFTPISLETIQPGAHVIALTSPGFEDKTIRARTISGHRLTISAQLAEAINLQDSVAGTQSAQPQATPSATPSPTPDEQITITPDSEQASPSAAATPYIRIDQTGRGWLRVRSGPGTSNEEVAKATVGNTYPHLDTQSGWYQIQYDSSLTGWVSGQYSTLVE